MIFLQSPSYEKQRYILREAVKIIVDFYHFYYSKQKEIPKPEELIAVLMYELGVDKGTVYDIINILNYYGFLVWDGYRYKLNYQSVINEKLQI